MKAYSTTVVLILTAFVLILALITCSPKYVVRGRVLDAETCLMLRQLRKEMPDVTVPSTINRTADWAGPWVDTATFSITIGSAN